MRRRLPHILLAAVLVLSFGLNARMAANPRSAYQSADERSYGKLAIDIADRHHYGGSATKMKEPLHWPPGAPVLFAIGHKLFPGANDAKTYDIRSAYWEQALLTTGTTALAAALAWILVGPVGGRAGGGDRRDLPAADRRDGRPALRAAGRVPAAGGVRGAGAGVEAKSPAAGSRRRERCSR